MILIQDLNWEDVKIDTNNIYVKELIERKNNIVSESTDTDFRILEEQNNKFAFKKNVSKIHINAIQISTVKSSIQKFQLNLYKSNVDTNIIIPVNKCYLNDKLQYLKLAFPPDNNYINLLEKRNVNYLIKDNHLFIDYNSILNIKKFLNIEQHTLYFIDNQLHILTNIMYKKINNAVLIKLKSQLYNDKFNIYRWNNFDDAILKLNNLLLKFNFNIDVVLNNAIANHYSASENLADNAIQNNINENYIIPKTEKINTNNLIKNIYNNFV